MNRIPPTRYSAISFLTIALLALIIPVSGQGRQASDENAFLQPYFAYGDRLKNAVVFTTCRENITEEFYEYALEKRERSLNPHALYRVKRTGMRSRSYGYDYSFRVEKGHITADRRLVGGTGAEDSAFDSELLPFPIEGMHLFLEAVEICSGETLQGFQIEKKPERIFDGDTALEVELKPALDLPEEPAFSVRIRFRARDGAPFRIVWEEESPGLPTTFEGSEQTFDVIQKRTSTLELGVENKGFRFPTRYSVEETKILPEIKKKFLYSSLTITYRDYRF